MNYIDFKMHGATTNIISYLNSTSYTMKVSVAGFSETLVLIYKTTSRHILEDFNRIEFHDLRQRYGNSFLF